MPQKLARFYGNLPLHSKGTNKGSLDRLSVSAIYSITVDQLFRAYCNWQHVFRFEESTLTFEQYLNKLAEAGIRPEDVGTSPHQYNLSRFKDEGPYTVESCRFITRRENLAEQTRQTSPMVALICAKCFKSFERKRPRKITSKVFCSRVCAGRLRRWGNAKSGD